jgi:predicted amidohydrolase YtcJ
MRIIPVLITGHYMKSTLTMLLLFLILPVGTAAATPAELVLRGGTIYTLEAGRPEADALAIREGRIVAVGSWADVAPLVGTETVVLDLSGMSAYPGFVDAHAHLLGLGKSLEIIDLTGTRSEADVLALVRGEVRQAPAGTWILGRGWDQNRWPVPKFPTHEGLSQAAPDHPVLLTRVDGHAVWANRRAMELAGIGENPAPVAGGEILRDAAGKPTGVFVDNAADLLTRHVPEETEAVIERRLQAAMGRCVAAGLTQVHDAGVGERVLAVYEKMQRGSRLPLRVWAMLQGSEEWLRATLAGGIRRSADDRLVVRSVKLYADGALGSRGAWLLAPYSDRPDTSGLPVNPPEYLERIARLCAERGFQVCTHAIGDRANREMLDIYQKVLASCPDGKARRFRVEHAQVLTAADIPRFHALGVIPSMQPTHCTSDMAWAGDRLGAERCRYAYAWASLLRDGNHIPMGSDFPVEGVSPLLGFYAAVTRQDPQGRPPGGWMPEERMSRAEALRSMTLWAAEAAFLEEDLGSLKPGKWADLTICDRDILKVPAEEILRTRVLLTIVGGRVVHDARPKEGAGAR